MEEVIKLFKDITEVGNKTGADKVNLTLDTANEIVKHIRYMDLHSRQGYSPDSVQKGDAGHRYPPGLITMPSDFP